MIYALSLFQKSGIHKKPARQANQFLSQRGSQPTIQQVSQTDNHTDSY